VSVFLVNANARSIPLADQSVHCVVTSPPYFALRDYGVAGQIGLEQSPDEYIDQLVQVFRDVKRVLRDDGTLWLNLGDTYSGGGRGGNSDSITGRGKNASQLSHFIPSSLKAKNLIGIPWRVAFALQADGWYLRSDIIWEKPNPMPESVSDRPTKAHEYLFLLAKSQNYFYDNDAIREPTIPDPRDILWETARTGKGFSDHLRDAERGRMQTKTQAEGWVRMSNPMGRNKRTVWHIATTPYPGAHFATYPPALVEPCIKAGTSEAGCCPACGTPWERVVEKVGEITRRWSGRDTPTFTENFRHDNGRTTQRVMATTGWQPACTCPPADPVPCTVLDPFAGSGTTLLVARQLGRHSVGLDLSYAYLHDQARARLSLDQLDAWTSGNSKAHQDTLTDLPLFTETGAE
jgi:DNA modification methylase